MWRTHFPRCHPGTALIDGCKRADAMVPVGPVATRINRVRL